MNYFDTFMLEEDTLLTTLDPLAHRLLCLSYHSIRQMKANDGRNDIYSTQDHCRIVRYDIIQKKGHTGWPLASLVIALLPNASSFVLRLF